MVPTHLFGGKAGQVGLDELLLEQPLRLPLQRPLVHVVQDAVHHAVGGAEQNDGQKRADRH